MNLTNTSRSTIAQKIENELFAPADKGLSHASVRPMPPLFAPHLRLTMPARNKSARGTTELQSFVSDESAFEILIPYF